ncbi:MAG: serine/threonine protein kinase [Myxococcales bacterium]|nr:serine/threonine protein kinase [Myxococcales bacterium]
MALLLAATWSMTSATVVEAQPVVVADVYGDPYVATEAAAASLLLRQALTRDDRPVVAGTTLLAKGGVVRGAISTFDRSKPGEVFTASGAKYGVQSEVIRNGNTLRMIVHVIDSNGDIVAAHTATSTDDNVAELVRAAVDGTRQTLGGVSSLPTISAPSLATYATAETFLVHGDALQAAARLSAADPSVVLESGAARSLARSVWTAPSLTAETRIDLVGRFGSPQDIASVATGTDARSRIARARAQFSLADLDAAEKELKGIPPTTPDYWAVEAELAHLRGDSARRDKAIGKIIAAPTPAGISFLSSLPSKSLSPELERKTLVAAEALGQDTRHLRAKLAIRSATADVDRDRALSLISLDDLRPSDIGQLKGAIETAATGGSASGLRLRAELKLRDGDVDGASKDLSAARAAGVEDGATWELQARIYIAQGNYRAAGDAYAHAGLPHEQARALRAAGDSAGALKALDGNASPSLLVLALRAETAATPADAATMLAGAAQLYPLNIELNRNLSTALTSSGNAEGAKASATLVGKMESFMPSLKDGRAATSTNTKAAAATASEGPKLGSDPIVSQMRELLASSGAAAFSGRRIAVGWLTEDSLFTPIVLDRDAAFDVVRKALSQPPFNVVVRLGDETFSKSNLLTPELAAFARDMQSDGVLLIGASKSGSGMRIEAFVFDPASARGNGAAAVIPKLDWMTINMKLVALAAGVVLLLFVIGLVVWIRGYGIIEVRIKSDPGGRNEAFRIVVSQLSARPSLGDPNAFRASAKRDGHKRTRKTVDLAGPSTQFRLVPGQWFVHVVGVYDRGDELRELDESCTRFVTLKRGGSELATIDLAPTYADVKIHISDVQSPIVKLWIEGRETDTTTMTNRDGEALLKLPVGSYMLVIDGNGTKLTRPISVPTLTIHKIHVNLERERKLAEVSGGLTLERQAVKAQAPQAASTKGVPSSSGLTGGLTLADGTGPAMPPDHGPPDNYLQSMHNAPAEMQTAHMMAAPSMTQGVRISELGSMGGGETTGFGATGFAGSFAGGGATSGGGGLSLPGLETQTTLLLGRYQIINELGRGAMGLVFHAWDTNLERAVAIKILSPELREHPQAMAFFVQEAKSLAQLNHSNIVSVYDQTSQGAQTLLIMEFVDGTTLEGILKQVKPLPPERALAIIEQLCNGLAYAHSKRIIHRDIKPANIFVSREGVVKLGDFGLARVVNELAIRKTEVRGTPLYMAPEQVLGTDIDHRADLYAVGCTLFELLTGQPPFIEGAVMYHHVHTPPPAPSSLVPELTPELDALVLSCLAKDVNERVGSATHLIEAIHGALRAYGRN